MKKLLIVAVALLCFVIVYLNSKSNYKEKYEIASAEAYILKTGEMDDQGNYNTSFVCKNDSMTDRYYLLAIRLVPMYLDKNWDFFKASSDWLEGDKGHVDTLKSCIFLNAADAAVYPVSFITDTSYYHIPLPPYKGCKSDNFYLAKPAGSLDNFVKHYNEKGFFVTRLVKYFVFKVDRDFAKKWIANVVMLKLNFDNRSIEVRCRQRGSLMSS